MKLYSSHSESAEPSAIETSAIVVGDLVGSDFSDLSEAAEQREWPHIDWNLDADSMDELAAEFADDSPLDWLIVATARPGIANGRLWQAVQDRIRAKQTLIVAGSWCEGELRTGNPLESSHRIYWHQFPAWLACETKSIDLANATWKNVGPVLITTSDYEAATAWCDVISHDGGTAHWQLPHEQLIGGRHALSLWIEGQLTGPAAQRLFQHCRAMTALGTPTMVLLDYPRHDEVRLAKELGAAGVVGRPTDADGLLARCLQFAAKPKENTLVRAA